MKTGKSAKAKVTKGNGRWNTLSVHLRSNSTRLGHVATASSSVSHCPVLSNTAVTKAEQPWSALVSPLGIQTLTFLETHQVSDRTSQR